MPASPKEPWPRWAVALRRRGWGPWVAALLEAGEPLWPLGAILLRAGGGWLGGEAWAAFFDDPQQRQRFVAWLTETEGDP